MTQILIEIDLLGRFMRGGARHLVEVTIGYFEI